MTGRCLVALATVGLCGSGACGTFLIDGAPCNDNSGCPQPLVCRAQVCSEPIVREGFGWIGYISDVTGVAEVWLGVDDGSHQVRVTDGLSTASGEAAHPTLSWDGRYLAVQSHLQADGSIGARQIWRLDADGGDLRPLVATGGEIMGPVSWEGDSEHLHYTFEITCRSELRRIDAVAGSAPETVLSTGRIASLPAVRPDDPDVLLFNDQVCASPGQLSTYSRSDARITSVPGAGSVVDAVWAPDGSRFAYSGIEGLQVHDGTDAVTLPGSQGLIFPVFDDTGSVFALGGSGIDRDVVRVRDGAAETVSGILAAPTSHISWARLAGDPDRDNDELGNGIDPTPDGG